MRSSQSLAPASLPWGLAWRVAAGQLVAWGILYYSFTVVVGPVQAWTGWSRTFLNGGLSLGLLTWGICAVPAGAWVQRRGGRGLMATASALGGAALILMGSWPRPFIYLLSWLLLGAAMAGLLYDCAFAVITAAFGPHYRRGITLITLVGGLASTVFIPLTQQIINRVGWQRTLVILGLAQVAIGVPLHAFGIPRFTSARQPRASTVAATSKEKLRGWWTEFWRDISDPRFTGLALWFTALAAVFTGLIFHFVPMLQTLGVREATILLAIAIFGPAQVFGRLLLTMRGDNFSTFTMGRAALLGLVTAVLILLLCPPRLFWLSVFSAIFGASNGVMTILRGTAIAEVFGRASYAELNGALSVPGVLAKAAAPLLLAGVWSMTGEPKAVLVLLLGCLLFGAIGLFIATRAATGDFRPGVANRLVRATPRLQTVSSRSYPESTPPAGA